MKENNKKTEKTKKTGKTEETGLAGLLEMSVMLTWKTVLEKNRDNLTQETAWKILEVSSPKAVELEYDVMRELTLPRARMQKLVVGEDGRHYDMHEFCGEGESDELQMWFDITAYWENLEKKKTQTKRDRKRKRKEKVRRINGLTDESNRGILER